MALVVCCASWAGPAVASVQVSPRVLSCDRGFGVDQEHGDPGPSFVLCLEGVVCLLAAAGCLDSGSSESESGVLQELAECSSAIPISRP